MRSLKFLYLLLALPVLALAACADKEDPEGRKESENQTYIDTLLCVSGEAATYRFNFFSRNSWKAIVEDGADWCTISPKDGGSGGATLGVKLSDNYDSCTRTATVRISSATHTGTIIIKQEQLDILDLTAVDKSEFEAPGGSFVINVDANVAYSYEIDSPWIECIKTKALNRDKLHFTVAKNDEGIERSAVISFSGNDINRKVAITQHAAVLECQVKEIKVPQAGKESAVSIRSNVSYEIILPQQDYVAVSESSFKEVTADGVEAYNIYKFKFGANLEYYERECPVIFRNAEYNASDTLIFIQKGIDLFESGPDAGLSFSPDSLTLTVDFDAGSAFDCQSDCNWLTLETPAGKPQRRLIHISQNLSGADRTCRIALNDAGGARSITIFQERIVMDYSRRRFDYSVGGGRDTLFFKHNIDYDLILPEAEWCSVSEEESGMYVLRVAETSEETSRECHIVFANEHYRIKDTIVIYQVQRDVLLASPQKAEVPFAGDELVVQIHANIPYDYVIEGNPDWLRENIDKSSDSVKTFFVRRNPEMYDRSTRIVFTGKGLSSEVAVSQSHPVLCVNDTIVNFTNDGGAVTVGVDANIDYEVSAYPSDWLSVLKSAGSLEITAKPNQNIERREGGVVVKSDYYGIADTVFVLQSPLDFFNLSQKQFVFDPYGGEFQIAVGTETPYSCKVEEGCGWIRDRGNLSFEAERNTSGLKRVGHIIFTDGEYTTEVSVTQDAAYLTTSEASLEFDTSGGTASVDVRSNVKYTLSLPECFWLQTVNEIGSLKVTAQENTTEEWRSTEISLISTDFGLSVKLPVRQRQKNAFQMSTKEFAFAPKGGSFMLDLHTNLEYTCTVVDQPVWLKSNGNLSFTVGKNTSEKVREAEILIEAEGHSAKVHVTQEAPLLQVSADSISVAAIGGVAEFAVASNIEYLADIPSDDWILAAEDKDGEYVFTLSENKDPAERVCYVIFTTDYGLEHTVKIVQAAAEKQDDTPDDPDEQEHTDKPFITVGANSHSFGPDGGTFSVEVNSNIEYTRILDDTADWLAEGSVPNSFTVERNTTGQSRATSVIFAGEGVRAVVNVVQEAPYITASKSKLYLSGLGDSAQIEIESNVPFECSLPDSTWCTVSVADNKIDLKLSENTSSAVREERFSVSNSDYSVYKEIVIVQRPGGGIINPAHLDFGPQGGEAQIDVYSDDYTYEVSDAVDWLHCSEGNRFAVDSNFSGLDRECIVRFMSESVTDSLSVAQEAAYLDVAPENFEDMDSYGGARSFTVSSNAAYRIETDDWISYTENQGDVVFTVQEHIATEPRSCTVSVISEYGLTHTYTFNQDFRLPLPPFYAKQDTVSVPPLGGEVMAEITPSEGAFYSEQSLPSYAVEDKDRRTDSTFVFTVDRAKSYREWVLTFKDVNGQTANVRFIQKTPSVTLSSSSRLYKAKGGESAVTVTANIDYQIYMPQDQPWLTYRAGTKTGEYYFVAAPNESGAERTASVVIGDTLVGVYRTLKIVQNENVYIKVDPTMIRSDCDGGNFYLDVTSNADVAVSSGLQWSTDKWFTVSNTDKSGRYLVKVSKNSQFQSRSSSITFGAGDITSTVKVTQNGYRKEGLYYSDDFSSDRKVKTIQKAEKGNGINLLLMGDAFSDRQINAGTYDSLMNAAVECLFTLEPYKSFRNLFNIYSVTVVSPTDVYEDGAATALSTYFGSGTQTGGDESMVKYYSQAALSDDEIQNSVIVVLMNKAVYAGTTYMKYGDVTADYGAGYAIAYVPLCTSPEEFCQVFRHEVGGHGFGKLEDEYSYEKNGEIPAEEAANYIRLQQRGYYKNVDFVSSKSGVRWSKFLSDERYKDEGLGVFEGACTYWKGAYRSTENSLMRYNTGGFNAPSREAIYYRLIRMAYGTEVEYNFEDFVKYDEINRVPATKSGGSSISSTVPPEGFVPLARPVILEN